MAGLIKGLLGLVRFIIIAMFIYINWPTLSALVKKEITWQESVDTLFSNFGIFAIILVLLLTFGMSFMSNLIVRIVVNGAALLVLVLLLTGNISIDNIKDSVNAHVNFEQIQKAADPCNWSATIEEVGGQTRTVLKNNAGETVGYASKDADTNRIIVKDAANQVVECKTP